MVTIIQDMKRARIRVQPAYDAHLRPDERMTFRLELLHRNSPTEVFALREGEGNDISVRDASRGHRQVVLTVKEQERPFIVEWLVNSVEEAQQRALRLHQDRSRGASRPIRHPRVVDVADNKARVEVWTDPSERHFLLGRDEAYYFACQLPTGAESIAEAHRSLKPDLAEREGTLRQGEWFFLPLTSSQHGELKKRTQAGDMLRRPNGHVRGHRHNHRPDLAPHIADQVLISQTPIGDIPEGSEFARGTVRQEPRHRALHLQAPHLVVRNLEESNSQALGGFFD